MHVPDGIVPLTVAVGGYAVTGALTWYTLRKINQRENPQADIPKASLLAAAFFVASWIHIPIPPTSVHLVLNGMLGVILGYYAFPAILIGLFFQAVLFQHGGLTTLGINGVLIGGPALVAAAIFQLRHRVGHADSEKLIAIFAFLGGATAILLSTAIFYGLIISTISPDFDVATEQAAVAVLSMAHVPLAALEGLFTAMLALFLQRVKPELLGGLREVRAG